MSAWLSGVRPPFRFAISTASRTSISAFCMNAMAAFWSSSVLHTSNRLEDVRFHLDGGWHVLNQVVVLRPFVVWHVEFLVFASR